MMDGETWNYMYIIFNGSGWNSDRRIGAFPELRSDKLFSANGDTMDKNPN
jgi:hypothetical protein